MSDTLCTYGLTYSILQELQKEFSIRVAAAVDPAFLAGKQVFLQPA